MKAEAVSLGAKLIEQEAELDHQFSGRTIAPESLRSMTAAMAATQGQLRATHLKYHLSTAALLSPQQIQQYAALRGYVGHAPAGHHQRQH